MHELSDIQRIVAWALPVLFAITVHEVSHGWVAKLLGDQIHYYLQEHKKENLRHPKRDMALVAIAGPASNLIMAILWAIILKVNLSLAADTELYWLTQPLIFMSAAGIYINAILMILNLFPLPPLDGGRVMTGLLPGPVAYKFEQIEPYGLIILVVMLFTGLLAAVLFPAIKAFVIALSWIFDFLPVMKYLFPFLF